MVLLLRYELASECNRGTDVLDRYAVFGRGFGVRHPIDQTAENSDHWYSSPCDHRASVLDLRVDADARIHGNYFNAAMNPPILKPVL
jgi:hypothetical protein